MMQQAIDHTGTEENAYALADEDHRGSSNKRREREREREHEPPHGVMGNRIRLFRTNVRGPARLDG